jgi:transcriptional regulator with XRE-family HTH domain
MNSFEAYEWQKLPRQVMVEIAAKEKAIRKQQGMSQKDLADRAGVSLGSLKRFESTGQISLESLLRLALSLKVLDSFELLFPIDPRPKTLEDLMQ